MQCQHCASSLSCPSCSTHARASRGSGCTGQRRRHTVALNSGFTCPAAVVDGEIKKVSLSDYLKQGKYVVLFFYPKVSSHAHLQPRRCNQESRCYVSTA